MIAPTTADELDALLPALTINPDGALMDATTGELVDLDDKSAVRRVCGAVLDAYAHAVHQAEALRLDIEDRRQPLITAALAAVEAELANDWDYQAKLVDHARQTATREAILAGLNGALRDRTGDKAISLDAGAVLLTFPKARETWSLAKPARWYDTSAARKSLIRLLSKILPLDADPDYPDAVAAKVLDWLDPSSKKAELGDVKITLRAPDAKALTGGGR